MQERLKYLSLSIWFTLFFFIFKRIIIPLPFFILLQARERISSTVRVIIKERRKNGFDPNKMGDFLDVLLSTNNLSDEEKVSFVLDSLLGGYETTSLLITMAVYFLVQSPSALNQVKVFILIFHAISLWLS